MIRISIKIIVSFILINPIFQTVDAEFSRPVQAAEFGDLEAKFRTFYFDRAKDDLPDSEAFTQALMLSYNSPQFFDVVQLNASVFTNLKLRGEDGEGGTGLLRDGATGSQTGYLKLAETNLKFTLPYKTEFDIGRMSLDTPLLMESDFRATPSLTQAAKLTFNIGGASLYGIISDKGSAKTETGFEHYRDSTGDDFNIYIVGAEHTFDNSLRLRAAGGIADDVMKQGYLGARYNWKINDDYGLLFDAHHYIGREDGDGLLASIGPDYSSDLTNAAIRLSAFDLKLLFSFQNVSGDTHILSWDGGVHRDSSYPTWNSVTRLDFNNGGEKSWQVRFDYDLKQFVEGLKVIARYTSGDDIKLAGGGHGSEWERDFDIIYAPPMIDNLSFRWRNAYVKSDATYNSQENRFIINYSLKY